MITDKTIKDAIISEYLSNKYFVNDLDAETALAYKKGFMDLWDQLSTGEQEWLLDDWAVDKELFEAELNQTSDDD